MEIRIFNLTLDCSNILKSSDAEKIRGYLCNLFWDNPYAHQHKSDGSFIYQYPCVQYKVIDNVCLLIGFNQGLDVVKKTFCDLKWLNLDGKWKEILNKGLESYTGTFSIASGQITYSFLTPWLALNKENYEKYQKLGTWMGRKKLMENILASNIISISKTLGYTVPDLIETHIIKMKEIKTSLKGVPILGFLGNFSVNFEIPDYWGIGKSVSRGFGTVIREH